MQSFDEARRCGVEDVDAVIRQPLFGMLDHLVHVLVVLARVLYRKSGHLSYLSDRSSTISLYVAFLNGNFSAALVLPFNAMVDASFINKMSEKQNIEVAPWDLL